MYTTGYMNEQDKGVSQPRPEFDPCSREEELRNKSIVHRMRNILLNTEIVGFLLYELDNDYYGSAFENPNDPDKIVRIDVVTNEDPIEQGYDHAPDIPEGFKLPAYIFQFFSYNNSLQVTTPYGILPEKVRGSNGKVYLLSNVYFLNDDGQAVKSEQILETDYEDGDINAAGAKSADIDPSEKDSTRYVHLNNEDYEKIETKLKLIEEDGLVERELFH